jgi:hypothetical protein
MLRMKLPLCLIAFFITINLSAQKVGIEYRTSADTSEVLHFLTFNKNKTLSVRFLRGPGVYFDNSNVSSLNFKYSVSGDTILVSSPKANENPDTILVSSPVAKENPHINLVIQRISNAKFILTPDNYLYDINSGFTYVKNRLTKKLKYGSIAAFDGKVYIIRKRGSSSLKRLLKDLNPNDFETNLIRGKKAFDKYGLKGINGVIELTRK